jgi:hypothetical protein
MSKTNIIITVTLITLTILSLVVVPKIQKFIETSKLEIIINELNPKLDPSIIFEISKQISRKSKIYELSPILVICVINKESNFKVLAESKSRCLGLMQINPKAHPDKIGDLGYNELFHIENNINIGCQILKEYMKDKTIKEALSRYLGKKDSKYIEDILVMYTDLTIKYNI